MSPVDPDKREAFLDFMAKEHGESQVVSSIVEPPAKIPFASPMLNWATTGGAAIGHIVRPYGPEQSGKSLSNWGMIANGQRYPELMTELFETDIHWLETRGKAWASKKKKKYLKELVARFPNGMEAIIWDTEQRADLHFAQQLGVDPKRVEVIDENIIEEIIDQMKAAMEAYHILIIDSASNAQSLAEAGLKPGDELRGSGPRAWSRLKQARGRFDRRENIIIIVDQVRVQLGKVGFKGNDVVEPPGIRFLRHNASQAIEFDTGKKLYLNERNTLTDDYKKASDDYKSLGTNGKEAHGIEMRCKVIKNSTGRPWRNARMRFAFPVADVRTGELVQEVGFDEAFELLEMGVHFDIIEEGGSGNHYLLDENYERVGTKDAHWRSADRAQAAIRDDAELRDRIIARARADM
jgi:RecA/RadA recombinase